MEAGTTRGGYPSDLRPSTVPSLPPLRMPPLCLGVSTPVPMLTTATPQPPPPSCSLYPGPSICTGPCADAPFLSPAWPAFSAFDAHGGGSGSCLGSWGWPPGAAAPHPGSAPVPPPPEVCYGRGRGVRASPRAGGRAVSKGWRRSTIHLTVRNQIHFFWGGQDFLLGRQRKAE